MKVLEKGEMPNGTKIQIEDWSNDYDFYKFGNFLVAYPIATHSGTGAWVYPTQNEAFRLELHCNNYEQAKQVFDDLANGTKTLQDYAHLVFEKKYLEFIK